MTRVDVPSADPVFVTGATGFIGRHLTAVLTAEGFRVKALVRTADPALVPLHADWVIAGDLDSVVKKPEPLAGCSTVIHCAAKVHQMGKQDPAEYMKENAGLTLALARKCIDAHVKTFVFFSTVKVFGDCAGPGRPFTEDDEPHPSDPYGASKSAAERGLYDLFAAQSKSRCIILRLPMVYGPGNKGNMLSLLKAASLHIPLPLKGAREKRSMIYVGNLCNAVCTLLRSGPGGRNTELYILTDMVDFSSCELYSAIYKHINGSAGVFFIPPLLLKTGASLLPNGRKVMSRLFDDYRFSCEKFARQYGWKPLYPFEQGLAETVLWYRTACISS